MSNPKQMSGVQTPRPSIRDYHFELEQKKGIAPIKNSKSKFSILAKRMKAIRKKK